MGSLWAHLWFLVLYLKLGGGCGVDFFLTLHSAAWGQQGVWGGLGFTRAMVLQSKLSVCDGGAVGGREKVVESKPEEVVLIYWK